jgi:hypothetical protein
MIADTVQDVARREVPWFDDRYTTLSGLSRSASPRTQDS